MQVKTETSFLTCGGYWKHRLTMRSTRQLIIYNCFWSIRDGWPPQCNPLPNSQVDLNLLALEKYTAYGSK